MKRKRAATWALVALGIIGVTAAGRWIDVRRITGDDIKGDWATYVAMTLSLAHDRDLRYERADLERFVKLFPNGPKGIFLKERYTLGLGGKTAVPTDQSLAYGKALIYPLAASPFVAIGGLGGLLVFNWVLLALCVNCGVRFGRARASIWGGVLGALFVLASVVPVYAASMTSEIFNFTIVFVAYFLWLYKKVSPPDESSWLTRPSTTIAAAVLIGAATYSKATHAVLIAPLVVDALFQRRIGTSAGAVLGFLVGSVGLFCVTGLVTGEMNYQGAARQTGRCSFPERFPFDSAGTTFEGNCSAMVTNDADTGRVLASDALVQIPINVFYFFTGRHAGFLPYFFPGAVVLLLWLLHARAAPSWQWATFLALAGSVMALIVFAPDSWNGGGGPPGNRYFLSLYPPVLFLLPASVGWWAAALGAVVGGAFTGVMSVHPFETSLKPWEPTQRAPLRWLPVELTLVNDLPCRLETPQCPILFVAEPTVQFYYLNANHFSAEGDGIWLPGGAIAETIVKTDRHPKHVRFIFSAPIDNDVWGSFAGRQIDVSLRAGEDRTVQISPPLGFRYHQNRVYLMRLTTRTGFVPAVRDPRSKDTRNLGAFVRVQFIYE